MATTTVKFTVPKGCKPGDKVSLPQADGSSISVTLPKNAKPGRTVEVRVPVPTKPTQATRQPSAPTVQHQSSSRGQEERSTISFTVPKKSKPGSKLQVTNPVDGSLVTVEVPRNARAGNTVCFDLPTGSRPSLDSRTSSMSRPSVENRTSLAEGSVQMSPARAEVKQQAASLSAMAAGQKTSNVEDAPASRKTKAFHHLIDSDLAHVSVCVLSNVLEVGVEMLPFGDAVKVLVSKIVDVARMVRDTDETLVVVSSRVERVGQIVDRLIARNAECARGAKCFQALVDTLTRLLDLAQRWQQKTVSRKMWKAREFKNKFETTFGDLDNCIDELTLALAAEVQEDVLRSAAELKSVFSTHMARIEGWAATQAYEVRQLQYTTQTLANRIEEMTQAQGATRGSPEEMKRLVREMGAQLGAEVQEVLIELQESSSDFVTRAPSLMSGVLASAGLTPDALRDDRARLLSISSELGDVKSSVAKFLEMRELDDAKLANILEDVAGIKRAVETNGTDCQAAVDKGIRGLEAQLAVDKEDILREFYKTREALGTATDAAFNGAFGSSLQEVGSDVKAMAADVSKTQLTVEEMREDVKLLMKHVLELQGGGAAGAAGYSATPGMAEESLRKIDKASVSATFKYVKRLSGCTDQNASVPFRAFELAFSALFLDGATLGIEQKHALRAELDVNGDDDVSEGEYAVFFMRWLSSGNERVKAWMESVVAPEKSGGLRGMTSLQLAEIVRDCGIEGNLYAKTIIDEDITGKDIDDLDDFISHIGVANSLHRKRIKARLSQATAGSTSSSRGSAKTAAIPDVFDNEIYAKLGLQGTLWDCETPAELSAFFDNHNLGDATSTIMQSLRDATGRDLLIGLAEDEFDAAVGQLPPRLQARVRGLFEDQGRTYYNLALRHSTVDITSRLCDMNWKRAIGSGSFGQVHHVVDRTTKKDYAVKFQALNEASRIRLGVSFAARSVEDATAELVALRNIQSEYIVRVFECGTVGRDVVWAIFEFCSGGDLKERLDDTEREAPSADDAFRWTLDSLRGLARIHQDGLSHRDIKTANCFLSSRIDADATCKLGDFGLAKQLSSASDLMSSVVGTKHNMAPELLSGMKYSTKADVWSLLVAAYELLCRKQFMWTGKNEKDLIETAPSPNTREGRLLRSWIRFDPAQRPSASELVALIDRIREAPPSPDDLPLTDNGVDTQKAALKSIDVGEGNGKGTDAAGTTTSTSSGGWFLAALPSWGRADPGAGQSPAPTLPPRLPPRPAQEAPNDGVVALPVATDGNSTTLENACRTGDLDVIRRELAKTSVDITQRTASGKSLLAVACSHDQAEAAHLLIGNGADPNDPSIVFEVCRRGLVRSLDVLLKDGANVASMSMTKEGWTPYHIACGAGQIECIRLLSTYGGADLTTSITRDGETGLLIAVARKNADVVQAILEMHGSSTARDETIDFCRYSDGFRSLHVAVMNDDAVTVDLLLSHGADAKRGDSQNGILPCHLAAMHGKVNALRAMVSRVSELIDLRDKTNGLSPLHLSCKHGHLNCTEALTGFGADVDQAAVDGSTPLFLAASANSIDIVRLLLSQYAADFQLTNNRGDVALMPAAMSGSVEMVKMLVEHGMNVNHRNVRGESALYCAALHRQCDVASFLLKNGADPNLATQHGETCVHAAAAVGSVAMLMLLVENNASTRSTTSTGASPLWMAAAKGHRDAIQFLKDSKADVGMADSDGLTPLHAVCSMCDDRQRILDVVRMLVASGVGVNAENNEGMTVLEMAADKGLPLQVIRCLVDSGAQVDRPTKNGSALLRAAAAGNTDCARFLCDRGANPNLAAKDGKRPIHAAADAGRNEVCRLLVERGVDVNLKYHNQTALDIASKHHNALLVKMFKEHGAKKGKRFGLL